MLRREAATWLARLQSGRDPDVQRKFEQWRDRDARNAAAFERVSLTYHQAAVLRYSTALSGPSRVPEPQLPVRTPRYALAAAVALAVLVPAGLLVLSPSPFALGGTEVLMLATRVGEIRSVKLSDGSNLTLDTATSIEVEMSRTVRKARLTSGRARFEVAESARRFVVDAGSTIVETDNGIVDVDRAQAERRVVVIAGSADVRQPAKRGSDVVRIAAGQAIAETSEGLNRLANLPAAPDWTRGMLQFEGAPIATDVVLANRYSNRHILLEKDIGELRVSGAFRAGDTEGLAKALAAVFDLSLRRTADGNLILSRKGSPAPKK
jgi:transmembrane sensor